MRLAVLLAAMFSATASAWAREVQLLDPSMFGQPTSHSITPLYGKKGDEIEPYMIKLDVACGRYGAATVYYKSVTVSEVRKSLDARYGDKRVLNRTTGKPVSDLWRVEDAKGNIQYAIQLADTDDAASGENVVEVIYITGGAWMTECAAEHG